MGVRFNDTGKNTPTFVQIFDEYSVPKSLDFMGNVYSFISLNASYLFFLLQRFGFHHGVILYYVRPYGILDVSKGFFQKVSVIFAFRFY